MKEQGFFNLPSIFDLKAITEQNNIALKKVFKGRIKGNFLIDVKDQIMEALGFDDLIKYYDFSWSEEKSLTESKRYMFDTKILPYFKDKSISDITAADIRAWQNTLIKENFAPTYLKTINNQMTALFNYACRYYDLESNPCRKAGSIGKSKADDMDFWTKEEFDQFLTAFEKKPEAYMAFKLLFWTGIRIGDAYGKIRLKLEQIQ